VAAQPIDAERPSPLTVLGGDYEHVLGFPGEGAAGAFNYRVEGLAALSKIVLSGQDFDVAEYSLANHIMLRAAGDLRFAAIPVFPIRAFRNASVFVGRNSPLTEPAELVGKRVGVSEFAMTAAVWARGHLHDRFGLDWRDIDWVTGPNPRFPAPEGVRCVQTERNLEDMVAEGALDALIAGRPKDLQKPSSERRLRYLVSDAEAIEREYFETTGLFPIMHLVVFHPRVMADPAVPRRVFDAYVRTKRTAIARRLGATYLPFAERAWERYCADGRDPFQYGLTDLNRRTIAVMSRYLREQGFIASEPDIDSLFVPGSADWNNA